MQSISRPPSISFAAIRTLLLAMLLWLGACKTGSKIVPVDPAYGKYVEAYTSGVVSKTSAIRIRLSAEVTTAVALNEPVKEALFSFTPSLKGTTYWVDARTVEFRPDENMKPAQLYNVAFRLGKVAEVPEDLHTFSFQVQSVKPAFQVQDHGLKVVGNSKEMMVYTGLVETADIEEGMEVEKMLSARYEGIALPVKWEHDEMARRHRFIVSEIKRGAAAGKLQLSWDGTPIGAGQKEEKGIEVPVVGDFRVMAVRAVQEEESYVLVQFSEAIATGQQLKGLVVIDNRPEISYSIDGSEVKLYAADQLDGNYTVSVNEGIANVWTQKLTRSFTGNVFFENRLPSVKIQGKGVILPDAGKLVLPFEAVNLNAVDVSILKVYESNIPQFMQYNQLGGSSDLRRVATPVVQQTVRLDSDKTLDLTRKQKFSLDIDRYLKAEPGAIYHVVIGFRPEYSLYKCTGDSKMNAEEDEDYYYYNAWYSDNERNAPDSDDAFWQAYDNYYPYGYNWRQRNNPCSPSFYNKERWASRNIMSSNIGLTAKRGTDNSMVVAVTDILSAAPLAGADLEVLDYQHQVLYKGKSDASGWAVFDLKKKPYLLVASNGNEKGYLKLDDGSSLLLSRFDVSGAEVKNGLKAFIYGERGVWRPGDTMYLNCIVEDKAGKLPKDHPVEFNLLTPQGQVYKKSVQTGNEHGFYLFTTATDASAVTGNWLARVKVGGAVFEKRIKVETVMPNRLKINLDFGKDALLGTGAAQSGALSAEWLFGAPARNLKARVDATLAPRKTVFKKYPKFHFDNPVSQYAAESKTVFDGTLSDEGKAPVNAKFEVFGAPGMLSAGMLVKVFEPGGAFSIDNLVIPYSPYKSYVGMQMPEGPKPWKFLMTDQQYTLPLVNVQATGEPLSGRQSVAIEMYRISWSWWWDNTGEGLSNFSQNRYNRLMRTDTVRLENGTGKWDMKAPGGEWGRYLVLARDLQSGHVTGQVVYFDDPWWQTRGDQTDQSAAAMLSFTANKEKYEVGEDILLHIPSSEGGRALISIESGSRVLKTDWVITQQGHTPYKFKAEPGMAPNIYVNISLLQPHSQTVNDLPIRMYGVIPLLVEDKNTVLQPVIRMPDALQPEQASEITVSETAGKPMAYNIAIVDEGLLDLTRFKTPDPHGAFYAREALGVKSWDIFDHVIGAWGSGLERILTIGGDAEASGTAREKSANRFKPVVKYLGPFYLKKGEKQTHAFTLPPYIGSVRAMVVAAGNGAYGFAEKAVAVKKPLMLLGTLPRVLGPGEEIRLPVTVFAMENHIKNVNISLQSNDFLQPLDATSQQVQFAEPGEKMVYFNVKVKERTGVGAIQLVATSGSDKAYYETALDVRNPNPFVTNVAEQTLSPGQTWSETVVPVGIPANGKATLEISAIPPINLEKRLDYLIRYPHGCLEQITSAVFPQLFLRQLTDLSDRRKAEIETNVRAVIEKYKNYQQPDGGLTYWAGGTQSDDWATSYAGYLLLKAKEQGYTVPDDMLQQWIRFQRSRAGAWAPATNNFYGGDLSQAFRLYLLALAKQPDMGAMNRLREFKYLSPEAKWRLAAAYQLAGHTQTAASLIEGLSTEFGERKLAGHTYGSSLRDQAMVLETLTLMGRRTEATSVLREVSRQLAGEGWYSTQTTAYSLLAIAGYCGANPSGEKVLAAATVNGKNVQIDSKAYVTLTNVELTTANKEIRVVNKGSNVLYARLVVQGQPVAGEQVQPVNNPDVLTLDVSYLTQDGKALSGIAVLPQGTDFVAKVSVRNPGIRGRYSNMTLSQVFPSGWEIVNMRMLDAESSFRSSPYDHQNIRDDRVYTHFGLREGETKTFYVLLNAAYPGRYFLPGVYCEGMYDHTISAGVSGRWVEVK